MNYWQALRQVRYELRTGTWTDDATKVFPEKAVVISQLPIEVIIADLGRVPLAVIRPLSGGRDPEHGQSSAIWNRTMAVTLAQGVAGDRLGQDVLMGAHRQGTSDSRGKGLFEIEERVLKILEDANALKDVSLDLLGNTIPEPVISTDDPSIVYCDYIHSMTVTRQRGYDTADAFVATDAGGGNCSLSWALPSTRFDLYSMILRRAAGSTPPATYDAGTGVTLSGLLATSVTDNPGVGTFSYSLFAAYDETRDVGEAGRSAEQYSAARTATVTVT